MTKEQKNEVIEALKEKFYQYNNFYVTNTESLTVDQVGKLRRICFSKQVEMKVAKNTLIKKALEALNQERYANVFDSLHGVTALLFSENAKEPALIISDFNFNFLMEMVNRIADLVKSVSKASRSLPIRLSAKGLLSRLRLDDEGKSL